MKKDIEKLSAGRLLEIGADESIQVPEGWQVKLPHAVTGLALGAAASVVLLAGIIGLTREPEPKDTFTDPYLAYAAVEQALGRVGDAVAQSKTLIDKQDFDKIAYWK
jgi:hypothetical protein